MARAQSTEMLLATVGNVEVSKFETATGARLRLHRAGSPAEAYLDPLELEGLTRVRFKPIAALSKGGTPPDETRFQTVAAGPLEALQNEFALVSVGVARGEKATALLIRDMNTLQGVLLSEDELHALLRARHMDLAPLVDTSDLVAIPEPDIDET